MLGDEDYVTCISITADGRRIASGGGRHVRVWDLETRQQVGDPFDAHGYVLSVAFSPDDRYIISTGGNDVCLWDTESFAIQGSFSPPTASDQKPHAPITQSIPPLHQHGQAHTKSQDDTSPISTSLLDLPVVVQQQPATQHPQERKPSVVDDRDTESIRPRLRPTEPQQDPPLEQDTLTVQPAVSGVPEDLPDSPPHLHLPLQERADAPASPESTNQQTRLERDADIQEDAQASHSRTRPSRNQNEGNVTFGQLDEPLLGVEKDDAFVPERSAVGSGATHTQTPSLSMMMCSQTM
ncbi:hypothetical protein BV22DRAFT_1133870 [Leucogyrophana mollusca]|uniref:Uncharacterized protein n=1 Tax=Leucogyrophana mollusca TaxID=85980 RepID=A0ACB8B1W3_9AGAM|nr:hypothetical protein BV22DRAFT_1133870 [Leucogyrophana mollusca]